jgi:hypothetical protein
LCNISIVEEGKVVPSTLIHIHECEQPNNWAPTHIFFGTPQKLTHPMLIKNKTKNPQRHLAGTDVAYDPLLEECLIGTDSNGYDIFGTCDPSIHFPDCGTTGFICTNRINRRDKFYPDKNPYYYIDPKRVFCYPNEWLTEERGGCSSCTPGRYCSSENRCILDDVGYPCERWL